VQVIKSLLSHKPTHTTQVNVQTFDNLPEHVNRDTELGPEDFDHRAYWSKTWGSYSAQLISVDSHTGKEYQELKPVKLIRNQHTGLEHWYKLYREETSDGQVKYFTSTEHIINGQGLGT
jgi:hypothetical protein